MSATGFVLAVMIATALSASGQTTDGGGVTAGVQRLIGIGGTARLSDTALAEASDALGGDAATTRLSGPDRFASSAMVSESFPVGSPIVIASGRDFADALTGISLAAVLDGPVLTVEPTTVPAVVGAAIERLQPPRIVVVGGPAAVADGVLDQIEALAGVMPERVSGPNRFATAAAVSDAVSGSRGGRVYVASGREWPDALAGSAAAAALERPLLLVEPDRLPEETETVLAGSAPDEIVVLGGTSAISDDVMTALQVHAPLVRRIAGASRYETADLIALDTWPDGAEIVMLASGDAFADALVAGPLNGRAALATGFASTHRVRGGPLLLSLQDGLPESTRATMRSIDEAAARPDPDPSATPTPTPTTTPGAPAPAPNAAPVGTDDAVGVGEDAGTGLLAAPGLLGNDTDGNGDTLTITEVDGDAAGVGVQVTLASGALLTVNADGSHAYDPNDRFETLAVGEDDTDTFTYTVSDGRGGTDTATVTVTISGANDSLVAAAIDRTGTDVVFGRTALAAGTTPTGAFTVSTVRLVQGVTDPDTSDTPTVTGCVADKGGTCTVDDAAAGTFTYVPGPELPTGATHTLTATLSDGTASIDRDITFTVEETIHYLDGDVTGTGTGTSVDPAGDTADIPLAAAPDADDIVIVQTAAAPVDGGLTMSSGQTLLGQPQGLTLDHTNDGGPDTVLVTAGGASPVIRGGIVLATDVTIDDITIGDHTVGAALSGSGVTGVTITDTTITQAASKPALDLATSTVAATFDSLTSTNADDHAIDLDTVGGTVTVTTVDIDDAALDAVHVSDSAATISILDGTIDGTTGNAVDVDGGAGDLTVATDITNAAARSLDVTGRTGGTISVTGDITDTGTGVNLVGNTGATIDLTGALSLTTGSATAFTATGGGVVTVAPSTGTADLTVDGAPHALDLDGITTGAAGLQFGTIDADNTSTDAVEVTTLAGTAGLGITTLDVDTTAGDGLQVVAGAAPITVHTVAIDGTTGDAIDLSGARSGAFTVTGGSIGATTPPAGTAVDVDGGTGSVTIGAAVTNTAGRSVDVTGRTAGTVTLSGAITDTGDGISLVGNTGATIDLTGALSLTTGTTTAFTATGGGTVNVAPTSGTNTITVTGAPHGIDLNGIAVGTDAITFTTVTTGSTSSHALDIDAVTGTDPVRITTLDVNSATGDGIEIVGGSAPVTVTTATIDGATDDGINAYGGYSGTLTVTDGSIGGSSAVGNDGIDIGASSGTITIGADIDGSAGYALRCELHSGGAVTLSGTITDTDAVTGNGDGISLVDCAGPVALTGTGSIIRTGADTAVTITNSAIGAAGLRLQEVSTNGADTGITLSSVTGTGRVHVTGDAGDTAGSGGTIMTSTLQGVNLTSVAGGVTLENMTIDQGGVADGRAVNALSVTGLTIDSSTLDGGSGISQSALAGRLLTDLSIDDSTLRDGGSSTATVRLTNLRGDSTIVGSTVTAGAGDNLIVENTTTDGTPDTLTITDSTLSAPGRDNLVVDAASTSDIDVTLAGVTDGNTLSGGEDAIRLFTRDSATARLDVSGTTISGTGQSPVEIDAIGTSTSYVRVEGLSGLTSGGSADVIDTVAQNTAVLHTSLTNLGINGAGASAIVLDQRDGSTIVADLTGTTITGPVGFDGVFVSNDFSSTGRIDLNATGMAINVSSPGFDGLYMVSNGTGTSCLDLGTSSSVAGFVGYALYQSSGSTFQLEGLGTPTTNAQPWVNTTRGNTGSVNSSADTQFVDGTCTNPTLP